MRGANTDTLNSLHGFPLKPYQRYASVPVRYICPCCTHNSTDHGAAGCLNFWCACTHTHMDCTVKEYRRT